MQKRIIIGRIGGVYGIRGWVRIHSFTVPVDGVLEYSPWKLSLPDGKGSVEVTVIEGRKHGNGCVARFASCPDRDAALGFVGADIVITRDRLPPLDAEEYYWEDLIGCRVMTRNGIDLGYVSKLMETGANDVLVVTGERERLIPFLLGEVILVVALEHRMIRVDWDAAF